MIRREYILMLFALSLVFGCNGGSQPDEENAASNPKTPQPRLVATLTLAHTTPQGTNNHAGIVRARESKSVAFLNAGKIEFVIAPGSEVATNSNVVARQDSSKQEHRLEEVRLQIDAARKLIDALFLETDVVLRSQRQAVTFEFMEFNREIDRITPLVKQGKLSQTTLNRFQKKRSAVVARYGEIKSQQKANVKAIDSLELKVSQLERARKTTEQAVKACELTLSDSVRVSQVHVSPGDVVAAGQTVATVHRTDSVLIDFALPHQIARTFRLQEVISLMIRAQDDTSVRCDARVTAMELFGGKEMQKCTIFVENDSSVWQPGELVDVATGPMAVVDGFQVPSTSIIEEDGRSYVLVVEAGRKLKKIEVRSVKLDGGDRRIQPADNTSLQSGMRVVEHGVHYLVEDLAQEVRVAKGR